MQYIIKNVIYFIDIFSSAKKYCPGEDNMIKKINFHEEMENINLIQNKQNSNLSKSGIKKENQSPLFLSANKLKLSEQDDNPKFPIFKYSKIDQIKINNININNNNLKMAPI